jgi:hypothetical protein
MYSLFNADNIDLRQLTVPEATRKPENMEEEEA